MAKRLTNRAAILQTIALKDGKVVRCVTAEDGQKLLDELTNHGQGVTADLELHTIYHAINTPDETPVHVYTLLIKRVA